MVRPTLSEAVNTTEGLHTVLIYVNDVTGGLFVPLTLFTIFIVVALGTYFSSQKLSGEADFAASFAVGGFITVGAAFIMILIPGLITTLTVVVAVTVSVMGALWLFFSRQQ